MSWQEIKATHKMLREVKSDIGVDEELFSSLVSPAACHGNYLAQHPKLSKNPIFFFVERGVHFQLDGEYRYFRYDHIRPLKILEKDREIGSGKSSERLKFFANVIRFDCAGEVYDIEIEPYEERRYPRVFQFYTAFGWLYGYAQRKMKEQ